MMQLTVFFVRLAFPWVRGAILFTLSLMATSALSLWIGVPQAVSRITDDWLDRAIVAGFPTEHDRTLYYIIWVLALSTIVAGWILLAYLTVFIVRLIF